MAVRKNTDMAFIDSFFDGIHDALRLYTAKLIGGDISAAQRDMCLCATCIGYGKKVVNRSGAKVGDTIYVTGTLGDSACGLALLKKMKKSSPPHHPLMKGGSTGGITLSRKIIEPLINRHLMPVAKNPQNVINYATSMIDISDGLLIDVSRLCDESKVGARIFLDRIPLSSQLLKAATETGNAPVQYALSGGEDYELLFTAPQNKRINAFSIGEITGSERVIVDISGKEKPFALGGYQHFITQRKGNPQP
jgi:thiamine-monophosphate kinase